MLSDKSLNIFQLTEWTMQTSYYSLSYGCSETLSFFPVRGLGEAPATTLQSLQKFQSLGQGQGAADAAAPPNSPWLTKSAD